MPFWIDAVAAFMALTGFAAIFSGVRSAYHQPSRDGRPSPFGPSIGEQAERWLHAQTGGE